MSITQRIILIGLIAVTALAIALAVYLSVLFFSRAPHFSGLFI